MRARLGRTTFWCFLLLNVIAAAVVAYFIPSHWMLQLPSFGSVTMPPLPARAFLIPLLFLPTLLAGMLRLHDIGRSGWPVLMPWLAMAGASIVPVMWVPLLLALNPYAQGFTPDAAGTRNVMLGLIIAGFLVAAGTLHTIFLWMQPGEPRDNAYGAAQQAAPAAAPPADIRLPGRMGRLRFFLILIANVIVVRALDHVLAQQWNISTLRGNDGAFLLSLAHAVLYLPAFYAAVLRLQDRDQSGLLVLIVVGLNALAPFAELVLPPVAITPMNLAINFPTLYLLFLCWQPGSPGPNRYGPLPGQDALPQMPTPAPSPAPPVARKAMPVTATQTRGARSFGRRGA